MQEGVQLQIDQRGLHGRHALMKVPQQQRLKQVGALCGRAASPRDHV